MAYNFDENTRIDELLKEVIEQAQQSARIIDSSNRVIYDILQGNMLQTGVMAYEGQKATSSVLQERLALARNRHILTDHRDGQKFKVVRMAVDQVGYTIMNTSLFTVGQYGLNPNSQGYLIQLRPLHNLNMALTNIKMIGTGGYLGVDSYGCELIVLRNNPPTFGIGINLKGLNNFNNSQFGGTYGLRTTNNGYTEIDLLHNPMFLRCDISDNWVFDWNNSLGVNQSLGLSFTMLLLEKI